jgi:ankyrin repeat protein
MPCILHTFDRVLRTNTNYTLGIMHNPGHNEEIVKLLLLHKDLDMNGQRLDVTPLLIATDNRDVKVVRLLLTRGDVDVNARDKSGIAPLLIAVKGEDVNVVKLLLGRHF